MMTPRFPRLHRPGLTGLKAAEAAEAPVAAVPDIAAVATAAAEPGARRRAAGFTLIEIMVVLVIIGVLAALIAPNVLNRASDAKVQAAQTDVKSLMQALKLYKLDNQRYPTAAQGLEALVRKPSSGPDAPNWNYQYLNPGLKGEIDVFSFGADGQPGGEGPDADIGSWQ